MVTVVGALRAVGVPVIAVADFDVLNEGKCLRDLLEALANGPQSKRIGG
jgi:hypothetical protein